LICVLNGREASTERSAGAGAPLETELYKERNPAAGGQADTATVLARRPAPIARTAGPDRASPCAITPCR